MPLPEVIVLIVTAPPICQRPPTSALVSITILVVVCAPVVAVIVAELFEMLTGATPVVRCPSPTIVTFAGTLIGNTS